MSLFRIFLLDINECSASLPICDVNANCSNRNGTFVCSCKVGYSGDGMTCVGKLTKNAISLSYLSKNCDEFDTALLLPSTLVWASAKVEIKENHF